MKINREKLVRDILVFRRDLEIELGKLILMKEIAEGIGISDRNLRRILNENPKIYASTAKKIAKYIGTNWEDYLIG